MEDLKDYHGDLAVSLVSSGHAGGQKKNPLEGTLYVGLSCRGRGLRSLPLGLHPFERRQKITIDI